MEWQFYLASLFFERERGGGQQQQGMVELKKAKEMGVRRLQSRKEDIFSNRIGCRVT